MTTTTFKISVNADAQRMCNELRKSIITWAQNQATGYRANAAIGHTAKHHDRCTAKAESYDFMVRYLQEMEIIDETKTPIKTTT